MPTNAQHYVERLRVPAAWWLLGLVAAVAVWWVFFVVTPAWVAAVAGLVTAAAVGSALLAYGGVVVRTEETGFRAGRALLPWPHVGHAVALDPPATRRRLGPEADARAYLLVRSYCRTAVVVYVDDAADPTPYWVVSTRHPQRLAERLRRRIVQD